MSGSFLDSNIVLYSLDDANPEKLQVASSLMDRCVADGTAIISFQVVQEVLNTVAQKFNPPYDADQSRFLLERILVPIWRIAPSQSLYELGIEMRARYKYHFYDSLIIAAAVSSGCTRLYTEDMQHGQRIEQLTIVNPFA